MNETLKKVVELAVRVFVFTSLYFLGTMVYVLATKTPFQHFMVFFGFAFLSGLLGVWVGPLSKKASEFVKGLL